MLARSPSASVIGCLVAALACACSSEEPRSEPATRTFEEDGVTVVESWAPRHEGAAAWSLSPEPLVTIGVAEGPEPEMFTGIYGAAFLPDGEILVLDASSELRVFSAEGEHLHSFGRSGSGPCEFGDVYSPKVATDGTIALYDQRQRRLSLISSAGDCLESFSLQVPDQAAGDLQGVFDDGTLLLGAWNFEPPPEGPQDLYWREISLFTRPPNSEATAVQVATVPWMQQATGRRMIQIGARAEIAAAGDRFLVTTGDRYEIRGYERNGTESLRMRRSEPPPPVTDEIVERFRDKARSNIAAHAPEQQKVTAREQLDQSVFPSRFPGYRMLVIGAEGEVWARRHRGLAETLPFVYGRDDPGQRFQSTEPVRWDVYAPDGTWLTVVEESSAGGIAAVSGDRVLVPGMDEAGVFRLRVHELIRESEE